MAGASTYFSLHRSLKIHNFKNVITSIFLRKQKKNFMYENYFPDDDLSKLLHGSPILKSQDDTRVDIENVI